jgi:tetratricopeptide (TPR) repeat protein
MADVPAQAPERVTVMKRSSVHVLMLLLLLSVTFSLATLIQPRVDAIETGGQSEGVLKILFGDGRSVLSDQLIRKADITFHSGYYPSIFDRAGGPQSSRHMTSQEGSPEEEEHERQMSFLGEPHDWIEAFGRHFMITEHSHLEHGNEREILPWLKLSAEMDPQRIDTYTVAAYWLRSRLGKVKEAEQFLREGLRVNPKSYDILFELGRLYRENYHDLARARNVWELALRRWQEAQAAQYNPDPFVLEEITTNLGRLEEDAGNFQKAISYLEVSEKVSPYPALLQKQIEDLRKKLAATSEK